MALSLVIEGVTIGTPWKIDLDRPVCPGVDELMQAPHDLSTTLNTGQEHDRLLAMAGIVARAPTPAGRILLAAMSYLDISPEPIQYALSLPDGTSPSLRNKIALARLARNLYSLEEGKSAAVLALAGCTTQIGFRYFRSVARSSSN